MRSRGVTCLARLLDAVGQRLLAGRDFAVTDAMNAPKAVIINETMARHFFGNDNPVGKRIDRTGGTSFDSEIVGVVRDAIHFELKEKPQRVFYMPYLQGPGFLEGENMILAVRPRLRRRRCRVKFCKP